MGVPNQASYFLVLYRPGAAWLPGKQVREQPLGGHVAYMRELQKSGTLRLGGPFKDDTGGVIILETSTQQAATAIVQRDPAVQARLLTPEVHPWHPAAPGAVGSRPW